MDSGNENISLPTENEDEGADIVSKTGIDSEIKIEIRSENNPEDKKDPEISANTPKASAPEGKEITTGSEISSKDVSLKDDSGNGNDKDSSEIHKTEKDSVKSGIAINSSDLTETNDTKAISDLKVKNDKNAGNNSPSSEKIIITVGNSDYEIPRLKESEGKENLIDTVVEIVTKESHPATEKNSYSMIKKENITDGLKNKTVKNEETTGKVHITRDSENDTLNLIAETDKETDCLTPV